MTLVPINRSISRSILYGLFISGQRFWTFASGIEDMTLVPINRSISRSILYSLFISGQRFWTFASGIEDMAYVCYICVDGSIPRPELSGSLISIKCSLVVLEGILYMTLV